ncbi:macro domain-containing protein [Microbulbifer sp. MLAF003]|uniref:macro domain-containing protein n=1 Tax=unclassified Microbulbifer TaxID=2619833 RepID=UPI0024AD47AB|nr:macro domain-containing protein [Microbulbifer sp. MLAF003]WHI49671.1 macro domain-containing protein [Microbulbifer sp. MLAF003]
MELMLPNKIYLIDRSKDLVEAWRQVFEGIDIFEVVEGDYFSISADAMVSPANSFGIMDGGLDLPIRNTLGFEVEERLQERIKSDFHGELPVGAAIIVPTSNDSWPYLIAAPTMRVPEDISTTLNAYHAFRAILNSVQMFNQSPNGCQINSIVCSGLGTGIGNLSVRRCAGHMRAAYSYLSKPSRIPSYNEIHESHKKLQLTY